MIGTEAEARAVVAEWRGRNKPKNMTIQFGPTLSDEEAKQLRLGFDEEAAA